mgnify:CR=1 FL=1
MARKLKPFGDNPNKQYLGDTLGNTIARLDELIREEESRGDISASDNTPRGKRLGLAYDALELLERVYEYES